jgi:hypothetical protein
MKKLFFIIVLLGVFIYFVINFFSSAEGKLFIWGIDLDIAGFELNSKTQQSNKSAQRESLELKLDNSMIRIQKNIVEDGKKLIGDRISVLNSLFTPTTSPYPEVITNTIECSGEFKPKEKDVKYGKIFTLFAGDRYNYGVCVKDLIKYNSQYGIFDCKEKGIFEILIFSRDNKKIDQIMQSFSC